MEQASTDPRIQAMHNSMTEISRAPLWTVVATAINRGELDPALDKQTAAAHTLGPLLYQCLFDKVAITTADTERIATAFLAAFSTQSGRSVSHPRSTR